MREYIKVTPKPITIRRRTTRNVCPGLFFIKRKLPFIDVTTSASSTMRYVLAMAKKIPIRKPTTINTKKIIKPEKIPVRIAHTSEVSERLRQKSNIK